MNLLLMHAITRISAQTVAQFSVEHVLNALPEGMLIAFFAWVLLRVLRRQNSGTRFAVLFLALMMVALLPLLTGGGSEAKLSAPAWRGDISTPRLQSPGTGRFLP